MGRKEILGIVLLPFCCYGADNQEIVVRCDHLTSTSCAADCPWLTNNNDREVQNMAISTLAAMAQSLLNIGADAQNPQAIGVNVINILTSFVNFVTFALKNPGVVDFLQDEAFMESLRSFIIRSIAQGRAELQEPIMIERVVA